MVSIVALAASGAPAFAQQGEVTFGVQMRGGASYLSLNHDASMYTPPPGPMASYGNPTSILSYEPLYTMDVEFVVASRNADGWFELVAGFPIAGGGTFADRDYEAGQALYSETFSDLAIGGFGDASLRFSLPGGDWQVGGLDVQPYAVVSGGLASYAAKGLRCGAACPSGTLPDTITVIGQDVFSASAGIGALVERRVSEQGTLDFRVEVAGGYMGVSDSHYFRLVDLGPVPNIAYDFATLGVFTELGYTHAVSDTATIRAGVFAEGQLGFGRVIFN